MRNDSLLGHKVQASGGDPPAIAWTSESGIRESAAASRSASSATDACTTHQPWHAIATACARRYSSGLGWRIYRIWGTSWYRYRSEQEERLKAAIAAAI